ncbi:MAG: hypothetical protein IPH86_17455 [bacterium]|nr:hypothetical protein [bacterium]
MPGNRPASTTSSLSGSSGPAARGAARPRPHRWGWWILLLASLAWLAHLTAELFSVWHHAITARDLVLIVGGLFLLGKATIEVHHNLEGEEHKDGAKKVASFAAVIAQIMVLDVVFSLDSVITAIGDTTFTCR